MPRHTSNFLVVEQRAASAQTRTPRSVGLLLKAVVKVSQFSGSAPDSSRLSQEIARLRCRRRGRLHKSVTNASETRSPDGTAGRGAANPGWSAHAANHSST